MILTLVAHWVDKGILPFSKQILDVSEKWVTTGRLLSWEIWEHCCWSTRARKEGSRRNVSRERGRKRKRKSRFDKCVEKLALLCDVDENVKWFGC